MPQRLRNDLEAARYTVETLTALWGDAAEAALRRGNRVPAARAVAGRHEPAATLAALFVLGLAVGLRDLDRALPSLGIAGAVELGLIAAEGDEARPLADLRPYGFVDAHGAGQWFIASDLGELALGHALAEDHVLGVGGASVTLSGLMTTEPVARALDLGTGCGIQAMHAARHAERVVATDISARALRYARLNAALNGVENIEFRLGSLFEPVAGERFDQIVSNPPFVITPRVAGVPAYEYRDGGRVGDGLVAEVIRGVAAHLEPGGTAQLLGNWEYRAGATGLDRVAEWLDGSGLEAWVVEREVQDTPLYAETWIRDGGTRPGAEFDRLSAAWLDDFDARGVTAVGFGYVTLRRPADGRPRLRRLERLPETLGSNPAGLGSHISAVLRAHDWLVARDDAALLEARLTVAVDVTEHRHYWPGEEHPTVMSLQQGGGFGRTVPVDTALAGVVGACDGELGLGAICGALADLLEVDAPALTADVLPRVRELVLTGFLVGGDHPA